jgi:hypothetical protein
MSGITVLAADPGGFFVVDGVVYGFRLEDAY